MAVQLLDRHRHVIARESRSRSDRLLGRLRHLDLILIGTSLALAAIGLLMVYSVTRGYADPTSYLKRQLLYTVLGIIAMVVLSVVDYRRLEEWAYPIFGAAFVTLLAVRAVGHVALGASREIAIGPLTIQPSEFAALSLIILVSAFFHRHEDALGLANLLKLMCLVGPALALVYLEPDLGTTIIMSITFVTMMVVGGIRLRYLALLALGLVTVFVVGMKVHILHDYQIERLSSFLHQDNCASVQNSQQSDCWQLVQAKTAIGAGGLRGTGLLHGAVTATGFVPDDYADMIFSAIGEQLGFVGCGVVIGLFALLSLRIVRAIQTARDTFARLLCAGALAFIVFSVFQNVGMNIGIMPITGIPLPFISFGGSALLATFAAVGLVVNVELRRSRIR